MSRIRLTMVCGLLIGTATFLSGCSKQDATKAATKEPDVVRQYRKESAVFTLSVSQTNLPATGTITIMLEIQGPPNTAIQFPDSEHLGPAFNIGDRYAEPPQLLSNSKELHRVVWSLLPNKPGSLSIPAMTLAAGSISNQTDPINITVTSLLPKDLETFEIRDIAPPETQLAEQRKQRYVWGIATGILAVLGAAAYLRLRHRRKPHITILTPREQALRELNTLPDDPLERIHSCTRVLLDYLENACSVSTEGKTTKEIIDQLESRALPDTGFDLGPFLENNDLIRFSGHIPPNYPDEVESRVRQFIEATKPEEPCD